MIQTIVQEIKNEWGKNKVVTGFMLIVVGISILNYIKPSSTSGILTYISISIINFSVVTIILVSLWWFWLRKKI